MYEMETFWWRIQNNSESKLQLDKVQHISWKFKRAEWILRKIKKIEKKKDKIEQNEQRKRFWFSKTSI